MQQSPLSARVDSGGLGGVGAGLGPGQPLLSAVIVEPALPDALIAVSAVTAAGFHVTVAGGFGEARALISTRRPLLLIAEIQLRAYNGLHLVVHGKAVRPDMAAVLTARRPDPAFAHEAGLMGATFVAMPTTEAELLAAVARTVMRAPDDTTHIRARFERRHFDRRARPVASGVERRSAERRRGLARLLDPDARRDREAGRRSVDGAGV